MEIGTFIFSRKNKSSPSISIAHTYTFNDLNKPPNITFCAKDMNDASKHAVGQ